MQNKLVLGLTATTLGLAGVLLIRTDQTAADRGNEPTPPAAHSPRRPLVLSAIQPIPDSVEVNAAKMALGARLFQDPILSRDLTVSCATCHQIREGGDDGRPTSLGVNGIPGSVNAPTVLNSGFSFRQFWDGRAGSLEDQVDGPIELPSEMNMTWDELVARLAADASYRTQFETAYGEGPSRDRIKHAIAEFERALITPGSPFDRYLYGEQDAISASAIDGYELFVDFGCASCHNGVNVGGNMFQHLGVMADFFAETRKRTDADNGRFNVTGNERDRHKFKVPTLRNIAETAPYFHDGSIDTLEEAVRLMAQYQLGADPTPEQVQKIVEFLGTLSGALPKALDDVIR